MKKLFALLSFLLIALPVRAQDVGSMRILASNFSHPGAPSTFDTHEINATNDTIEYLFQCELADTITQLGYLYGVRTGTPCAQQISLQGVNTSGRADGTIKSAGAAVATYTPPADTTQDNTWQWKALGGSYACARGEFLSAVIADVSDACTPDASNKSSYKYRQPNTWAGYIFPHTVTVDAGVATLRTYYPVISYKSATRAYVLPVETTATHDFGLDSVTDERGNVISMPASVCDTWTLKAIDVAGYLSCPGQSVKALLYEGTTVRQDVTIDCDSAANTGNGLINYWFDEPTLFEMDCGTSYRVAVQPQANGGTQTGMIHFTVDAAFDMSAYPLGTLMYATSRVDTGAWIDDTAKRNHINLTIGSMTPPAGGGGGGGGSVGPIGTKDIYRLEDTAVERRFPIYLVDATDGLTEETGIATTGAECRISKNGGASANCAGTFGENETGLYYYEPTLAEHDTLGYITVRIADAAARKFIASANIVAYDPTSGESFIPPRGTAQGATIDSIQLEATETFADDELNNNTAVHIVSAGAGGGQTRCICDYVGATDTATPCQDWETIPTAPIKYSLRDAPNCTGSVAAVIDLDAATGTLDAAQFGAGAINANALSADAGTELGTATWATTTRQLTGTQAFSNTGTWTGNLTGTIGGLTAGALKDFFDTDSAALYSGAVAGSVVKEIADNASGGGGGDFVITTGTAQSITASPPKMRLDATAPYANDVLNDHTAVLILTSSGNLTAVGQVLCISKNVAVNDEVTFTRPYKSLPSGIVTYAVIPQSNCNPGKWPISP